MKNTHSPTFHLEKMVLELSGDQAEIVHNAFKKARKESGQPDKASLVTYLARIKRQTLQRIMHISGGGARLTPHETSSPSM